MVQTKLGVSVVLAILTYPLPHLTSLLLSLALDSVGHWNYRYLRIVPLLCSCVTIPSLLSLIYYKLANKSKVIKIIIYK
jgi:hypothetical protein